MGEKRAKTKSTTVPVGPRRIHRRPRKLEFIITVVLRPTTANVSCANFIVIVLRSMKFVTVTVCCLCRYQKPTFYFVRFNLSFHTYSKVGISEYSKINSAILFDLLKKKKNKLFLSLNHNLRFFFS